jgi:orotate phosphoribosyltransferase
MFPIDTVKTRMQALAHPGQQVSAIICTLNPDVKQSAIRRTLRAQDITLHFLCSYMECQRCEQSRQCSEEREYEGCMGEWRQQALAQG